MHLQFITYHFFSQIVDQTVKNNKQIHKNGGLLLDNLPSKRLKVFLEKKKQFGEENKLK